MQDEPSMNPSGRDLERDVAAEVSRSQELADELAREVGDPRQPGGEREAEFFESRTDSEASLDTQLEGADAAIKQTAQELGESEPEAAKPAAPRKKIALPPKRPREAAGGGSPSAGATSEGNKSDPPPTSAPPGENEAPQNRTAQLVAARVDVASEEPQRAERPRFDNMAPAARSRSAPWQEVRTQLAELICAALEQIDRPFRRVGDQTRAIIGWIALFLAVAAGSMFLFFIQ